MDFEFGLIFMKSTFLFDSKLIDQALDSNLKTINKHLEHKDNEEEEQEDKKDKDDESEYGEILVDVTDDEAEQEQNQNDQIDGAPGQQQEQQQQPENQLQSVKQADQEIRKNNNNNNKMMIKYLKLMQSQINLNHQQELQMKPLPQIPVSQALEYQQLKLRKQSRLYREERSKRDKKNKNSLNQIKVLGKQLLENETINYYFRYFHNCYYLLQLMKKHKD